MLVQEHAESLLAAWLAGDANALEKRITLVLNAEPSKSGSPLEYEERELLESISFGLWAALISKKTGSTIRAQSTFQLLFHLAQRTEPQFRGACVA